MAARPVVLSVDDDPAVGRAVVRDIRARYGDRYQVVAADSGETALGVLDTLAERGQPVALLLADQRMPRMDGVSFLEEARRRAPQAKQVLLTAYADSGAAIRAINDVDLDYYLVKPWDPPEERLYPPLDELLYDWQADVAPALAPIVRIVGHRFSDRAYALRDFLTRNLVPAAYLDVDLDPDASRLLRAVDGDAGRLPVVVFADGSALQDPELPEVARRIGISTEAAGDFYDLLIVGAGPAGLAGAVYGASEGLRTVLVDRAAPGGQAGQSSRIENYLGFPAGLSGGQLARRAADQARRFGAETMLGEIVALEARGPARILTLADGRELAGHAVLIATGVAYRRLETPGLEPLVGCGVYYGAARTEAMAAANEDVVVVGGANSAGQAALFLASRARRVTVLYRGSDLRKGMSEYLVARVEAAGNVDVRLGTEVTAVHGAGHLEALSVCGPGGDERLPATAAFIFIGARPPTDWMAGIVARDRRGFVMAGPEVIADGVTPAWPLRRDPFLLETSLPGCFVAGDVRSQSIKRVASAVGEGSMAVQFVHRYLGELA
jgi:thioredoxin reductase (NADPH)